jgi:hypothetical protein
MKTRDRVLVATLACLCLTSSAYAQSAKAVAFSNYLKTSCSRARRLGHRKQPYCMATHRNRVYS